MAKKQGLGSAKRFGARYGPRGKNKLAKIEAGYRIKQKCPYCGKKSVKRLSLGIWFCRKCSAKFTGKAYTVKRKIVREETLTADTVIAEEKESLETVEE